MRMFKTKAIAVTVAIGLMCSSNLLAQTDNGKPGGLFGINDNNPTGMMGRSESDAGGYLIGQGFGATNSNITGQTFGAPLGSGLFILLVAGAGYATINSRKKQNKKE